MNFPICMITSEKFRAHNEAHRREINGIGFRNYPVTKLHLISDQYGGADYGSNVSKMIAGLYLAGDAEWSLHMDHDAWVDLHSVEEYLRMGPSEWNAQGKITKTWPDRPEFQYLSGPCFLLSRHVRKVLIRSLVCNPQPVVRWGDVLIGLHLERCGVPLVDWGIDFLHYQTPEQITQNYCNV